MSFLKITNLRKSYGALQILKDINIEIEQGGFLVLVGPSGCGKSTLLNTIAGLEPITSGDIAIDGRSVSGLHPSKRDIAMVFQSYALYPNMTVSGNIAFGMEIRGVPKEEREKAIQQVAEMLQIGHLLERKPGHLSGGQRQRVAMGRALVRDPKLFLFDEPLSNLDAKLRVDMRTEIKRLHQRMKTTIVYVTHDQIEAMTLATKIAVLKDGVLQQFGAPAEIYNNPANIFVADFMGSPAMNLLTARVHVGGSGVAVSMARQQAEPLVLSVPHAPSGLSAYGGKEVIFGIRPEALTDPDGADRNARTICEGDCLIEVVEPAGADTFAVTRLGGKEVVARLRADVGIAPGQTARLAFNLDKAVFFDSETRQRIL
ncbi:ABC transporter ATP-binding protein [Rhizobium leguminosarum]|uniref:ABC transporter ATP-binding protein n=1 Tax=Rhizobium leguminosarum TaxID=384 RepID=UPI001C95244B|nr:sn-glycerol-3-phosphate ABC transporter ATP-binding protein UgpC [Rhizobium leguminosarum]MBY5406780.1 sn-glycerol-3-phosphate ABC transporter ATP-binding protein UgpC [Rhizobium leguminosarum]